MGTSAMLRSIVCATTAWVFVCAAAAGAGELPDASWLLSHIRMDRELAFCGGKVPIENDEVGERFDKELLLTLWDRPQVILWLKRSRRYLPIIEKILRANGLPDDLKYIAVAESALRPHAGSRKGAIGFWQFVPHTGRKYGLKIDGYVDERRNIFASTAAAVRFLKDLYSEFGSWELAAAAYNMGEEGLLAEIMEQGTDDFYALYLPLETQLFLFRILAIKLILSAPEKYGFTLKAEDYYAPLTFDRVEVDCPQEIPIRIVAQAAGTDFKAIKDLNPELRGHYLAQGHHRILVPNGAAEKFSGRYAQLARKFLAARKEKVYVVQKGDNLSLIADRFNVPLAALIIWNRIDLKRPINPGQRLIIYAKEPEREKPPLESEREESG